MAKTTLRACLALSIILSFLVAACTEDDPLGPATPEPAAVSTIGPAGGTVSADETAVLHVPAGAFTEAVEVTQYWRSDTPAAPTGWVQVGPSVRWAAGDQAPGESLQVVLDPAYDPVQNPGDLAFRLARIVQLADTGDWLPLEDSQGLLTLPMSAPVNEVGTFAVHVADPLASTDLPLGAVTMRVSHTRQPSGQSWMSAASFEATEGGTGEALDDAGGTVRLDGQALDLFDGTFIELWYRLEFEPGSEHTLTVPGSDDIPPLDLQISFVDRVLEATAPAAGEMVDPATPYTITWSGSGAGLVWLAVYGDGPGGFEFLGQMTQDDGEFVLTADMLARFAADAEVQVFLQHQETIALDAAGYAVGSNIHLECSSSTRFRIGSS